LITKLQFFNHYLESFSYLKKIKKKINLPKKIKVLKYLLDGFIIDAFFTKYEINFTQKCF